MRPCEPRSFARMRKYRIQRTRECLVSVSHPDGRGGVKPGFTHTSTLRREKQFASKLFFGYSGSALALNQPRENMDTAEICTLTRDEMESRRLLAAQDLQTGLSQSQVARKFGVSRTTASRWNRSLSGKGVEALKKRRAPGRPS